MSMVIQVLDKNFVPFITKEELAREVESLANEINNDFKGEEVIFISVLNGSFMFSSDMLKNITLECEISFVKMRSYQGTESTGTVDELIGLGTNLQNKTIIILEDIVDSGLTIDKIIALLSAQSPKNIKICTLLYKPDAFKGSNKPNYVGFSIPNAFVVGYGLDYNEKGRNLDAIYQIKQ